MSKTERKQTLQSIGWVRDMFRVGSLNLEPPYQRRSVWNQDYKQFFIDTILNNYAETGIGPPPAGYVR